MSNQHRDDESTPLIGTPSGEGGVRTPSTGDYSTTSAGGTNYFQHDDLEAQCHPEIRAVDEGDTTNYYQNPTNPSGPVSTTGQETELPMPLRGGPSVTCRICEADILLEGRTTHVVRCSNCNEVTPIRAAPPGKKYVRCPCNCLLICKASSNRIACPRPNCRRVITLVATAPMVGTAMRAPAGTCRVQCCHCQEMFMFNTLANNVAICPHCKKSSSVGADYARSRALVYFVTFLISFFVLIGVVFGTHNSDSGIAYILWIMLAGLAVICVARFIYFARLKVSTILGAI